MLIDSHAHYNHRTYTGPVRCLRYDDGQYSVFEADREALLEALRQSSIRCSVEPGITLESCAQILELAQHHPGRIFPAMGIHPTRCPDEPLSGFRQLAAYAAKPEVIAIGETGLDFHKKREEQHRLKQYLWFWRQLNLAHRLKKPVILHVRDAHAQALRVLRLHPARRQGGVIHCFYGSSELAQQYLLLGYHIGIGATLLQSRPEAEELAQAVEQIPMERILLETDAPFILPACRDQLPGRVLRRTRNTSLILPAVARRIGQIKNLPAEQVERICGENTVRLFGLKEIEL